MATLGENGSQKWKIYFPQPHSPFLLTDLAGLLLKAAVFWGYYIHSRAGLLSEQFQLCELPGRPESDGRWLIFRQEDSKNKCEEATFQAHRERSWETKKMHKSMRSITASHVLDIFLQSHILCLFNDTLFFSSSNYREIKKRDYFFTKQFWNINVYQGGRSNKNCYF